MHRDGAGFQNLLARCWGMERIMAEKFEIVGTQSLVLGVMWGLQARLPDLKRYEVKRGCNVTWTSMKFAGDDFTGSCTVRIPPFKESSILIEICVSGALVFGDLCLQALHRDVGTFESMWLDFRLTGLGFEFNLKHAAERQIIEQLGPTLEYQAFIQTSSHG